MRFPYIRRATSTPIFSLGNVKYRYRPLIDIQLSGPGGLAQFYRATLDSGADDTVFPSSVASDLDIDLAKAPEHTCVSVGGHEVLYHYAEIELKLTDNEEMFIWNAIVGFGEKIKRPLLQRLTFASHTDEEKGDWLPALFPGYSIRENGSGRVPVPFFRALRECDPL